MWTILRLAYKTNPDLVSSISELLHSTSRNLIVAIGILYVAWHILFPMLAPDAINAGILILTLIMAPSSVLAWHLLDRHVMASQIIWQAGLSATIVAAVYVFQRAEIAFLLALLPLVGTVIIGWPGGLVAELLISALAWLAWRSSLVPSLSSTHAFGVALGGALSGALGWTLTYALTTVTHWSLFSYNRARECTQEAQDRRAELVKVLKDLDQAYYRLERANASLVAAWNVADEAERFKSEFVANVSHELRTPLNLIIGFAEVMMTAPESYGNVQIPGPYRSDLNAIYNSAQHLLALVDDVLDLARIDAGQIALVRDEVELGELVRSTADMIHDYATVKGLELHVQVADDLRALWIDRLRIRQVLLNLLVNAARFTEQGEIRVEVLSLEQEVMVRVSDTGRGIPEQDLPKVFQEFRTVEHSALGWKSGTGLGLPISKRLIDLHGGRMGVESVLDQGATFWFALPHSPPLTAVQGISDLSMRRSTVRSRPSERAIVVVHEEPRIVSLLQRYLSGYQVMGAASWQRGLSLAQDTKAIALVTHPTAPLSDTSLDIPIVRCPLPSIRRAAIALGADDFLVKPVSAPQLWVAIERLNRPVRRVLVADDNPEVVRLFRRMLSPHIPAQDCLEAHDGSEALEVMKREKPDLVLLDLSMPEIDGEQVLERLAQDAELCDIPVIIISVRGSDRAGVRLPGAMHVSKPGGFQLGEIARALEAVLNALSPGWGPGDSTGPEPARVLAASPAWSGTPPPPT